VSPKLKAERPGPEEIWWLNGNEIGGGYRTTWWHTAIQFYELGARAWWALTASSRYQRFYVTREEAPW